MKTKWKSFAEIRFSRNSNNSDNENLIDIHNNDELYIRIRPIRKPMTKTGELMEKKKNSRREGIWCWPPPPALAGCCCKLHKKIYMTKTRPTCSASRCASWTPGEAWFALVLQTKHCLKFQFFALAIQEIILIFSVFFHSLFFLFIRNGLD